MSEDERATLLAGWHRAVEHARLGRVDRCNASAAGG